MSRRARKIAATSAASVFAALGDTTRLSLLARLCGGQPHSITQLTQGTNLTRQGVTKHLAILEKANIVTCRRVGRESRFAVRPAALGEARAYLERANRQWDLAIARLQRHLDE